MKKKILVILSLAAMLAVSTPAPDSQAAWKITDQGRQYTTNTEQGYATGWKKLGKYWYFFDQEGIMKTGWVYNQNNWYYLKSNGRMAVNTWIGSFYLNQDGTMARNTEINGIKIGADGTRVTTDSSSSSTSSAKKKIGWYRLADENAWYYYDDKGNPVTGWLTLPNGKYYMDLSTKVMCTGFKLINGQRYYFNPSKGTVQTGWYKVRGRRYYASASGIIRRNKWLKSKSIYTNKNGAATIGFAAISGNTYYFNPATAKKTIGWTIVGGKWYYFDTNGIMAKKKWVTYAPTGKKCYLQADGTMAANTWVGKYYVGSNGYKTGEKRVKGLFTEDGKTYFNNNSYKKVKGWKTVNNKKYYFGKNYCGVTGLQTIDGKKYYFNTNSEMQTGLVEIGDESYYFQANGEMLVNGSVNIGGIIHQFGASGSYVKPVDKSKGSQIARFAKKYVGYPYVYGGTSLTHGADCSGFTQTVMASFGIKIPRVAEDQANGFSIWDGGIYTKGTKITPSLKNLLPGDLVFYYSPIGHVGIYIGNGQIVHASNPDTGIIISPLVYSSSPVTAMRYWS